MTSAYKAIQPAEFYRQHLEAAARPDGRALEEGRFTVLKRSAVSSTTDGSAYCRTGHTAVLCGIKAEICTPSADRPDCGILVPNLELPPLCHHQFRPGPPSQLAQLTSSLLLQLLDDARPLDLSRLCISPGRAVWVLYCDLVCLSYDGNVVDAAVAALCGALADLTLPEVSYDPQLERVTVEPAVRRPVDLAAPLPLAATLAVFDNSTLVVDPAADEEALSVATVTVAWAGDKMVTLHKPDGAQLTQDMMNKCVTLSKKRTVELRRLFDK